METDLLLISIFPILGYLLGIHTKSIVLLLTTSAGLIFLIPVVSSPYVYSTKWLNDFLFLLIFSGAFGFFVQNSRIPLKKKNLSILLSIILFICFFFHIWVKAMAGSNEILKSWRKNSYEINYIESRGFSGQPLYYYELKKYKLGEVLEVNLDRHELRNPNDTLCEINLYDGIDSKFIIFDKCKENLNIP